MEMKKNVGSSDRYIRFLIGLGFIMNIFSLEPSLLGGVILLVLGLLLMFTSFFGYCYLYDLLKFNTLGQAKKPEAKAEQAAH